MRTLLRAFVCAVVLFAVSGCGGSDEAVVPKKFAPPPPKGAQPDSGGPVKTKVFKGSPGKTG